MEQIENWRHCVLKIRTQVCGLVRMSDRDTIEISLTSWWRHQMETFSALLALCAGNSPVPVTGPGEFPAQRPVTRSCDVFFDLTLNNRLSKQPRRWWFETPPWSLWRQCNGKLIWIFPIYNYWHIAQRRMSYACVCSPFYYKGTGSASINTNA